MINALCTLVVSLHPSSFSLQPLFISGRDGYHTYRIPAIIATARGTLLAFCEGRKHSRSDTGDIDLLVKRSTDGGQTWSEQQVVWDDGHNTCGNPCPVLDRDTGIIWLPMTWNDGRDDSREIVSRTGHNTRRVFLTCSKDDGVTWAKPWEITKEVKPADWTWYATGPGVGIQIERGPHRGRLVIPCDHTHDVGGAPARRPGRYSHVIYSDDHGKTWRLGGSSPEPRTDECGVVELTGDRSFGDAQDRLLLNMRNHNPAQRRRQVAISTDGGLTWTDQRFDPALLDPMCQGAICRYSWPEQGANIILFSNPAHEKDRVKMTLRLSYDEGKTWPVAKTLHGGPSAYSCLTVLPDHRIACLYEAGQADPYETITLALIEREWLR